MRILMLTPHEGVRGPVPALITELVAALQSAGCTVVTVGWGRRTDRESLLAKVLERFGDILTLQRQLRGRQFDVGVVHTAHDWRTLLRDSMVVTVLRRRCRLVVLQLHGSDSSRLVSAGNRAFILATRLLAGTVHAVLVLSTEEQRQWQAFDPRVRAFVVKNPYVQRAGRRPHTSTGLEQDRPRLLFVGRLVETKGIFELVEAFARVVREIPCELVVVGEGAQEQALRERIARLGIQDSVTITGYLSRSDLNEEYDRARLFVFPSWTEGFPTVLAEAMDAGLPIVTTPIRGAADHLIADEHALFVEPRDAVSLAEAMLTLLRDDKLRDRMGNANRRQVRVFDPHVVAHEYREILRSLLTGPVGHTKTV